MAENSRPPVAIRIVRPYDSEDELLDNELETIGKTSVVLIGAHPRPTGVILRFEVALASGATVLRGEGRVLAHKENAFRGQSGLTLRFTRLDPKSKAIVDRATAMREARAHDGGTSSRPAPIAESPIAEALTAETPPPGPTMSIQDQEAAVASARAAAREKANAIARENAKRTSRAPGLTPPPSPADARSADTRPQQADEPESEPAAPEPTPVTSIPGAVAERPGPTPVEMRPRTVPAARAPSAATDAPPNRAELLARLRDRAGKLPPERVEQILAARPPR